VEIVTNLHSRLIDGHFKIRPPCLYTYIYDMYADYKKSFMEFMQGNMWTVCIGLGAFVSAIALYFTFNRQTETEVQKGKGSSHKDVQRAKERRVRKGGRNRGKLTTIHDIDEAVVTIGRGVSEGFGAQVYNDSNITLERNLSESIGSIQLLVENTDTSMVRSDASVSFTNVWGNVFMIPRHFYDRAEQYALDYKKANMKATVQFRLHWKSSSKKQATVKFSDVKKIDPLDLDNSGHMVDVYFLYIPGITMGKDIRRHFVSSNDECNLYGAYLYGCRTIDDNCKAMIPVTDCALIERDFSYVMHETTDPIFNTKINARRYVVPLYYNYRSNTVSGDCGMLLLHTDSKYQSKILGIHTAGSTNLGAGLSNCVFREDLDDVMDYIKNNLELQAQVRLEYGIPVTLSQDTKHEFSSTIRNQCTNFEGFMTNYTFDGVSKKFHPNMPLNTSISPSIMYDNLTAKLGPATGEPAKLKPFINREGEKVSPFMIAFKKLQNRSPLADPQDLEQIEDHIVSTINSWKPAKELGSPRLLTEHEVFNGCAGVNPIDVSTAPGFPFKNAANQPGKKSYITTTVTPNGNVYAPTEQMRRLMKER